MHGACLSVTGLRSYTWYDLYVQPFHHSAEGASSNVVRERTEDDGILVFLREIFATKLLPCLVLLCFFYLQCFDAVGWAAGRASGL